MVSEMTKEVEYRPSVINWLSSLEEGGAVDKLLALLNRHLEEVVPEDVQLAWLVNASLTGIYIHLTTEIGRESQSTNGSETDER